MKQIFVVDDDFDIIHSLSIWLRRRFYFVQGFSNSKALFEGLEREVPDAILLDVNLGKEDGRTVCKEIRKRYDDKTPIILFSTAFDSMKRLHDDCADDFIKKDSHLREIFELLKEQSM